MTILKRNKVLQSLVGFVSIILIFLLEMFLINKIQLMGSSEVSVTEKTVSIICPVLFGGFIVGLALFSKRNSMNYLYYPAFIVSFVSGVAAYFLHSLDGSIYMLFWGLILIPLGKPFTDITKGLEKFLEYTTEDFEKVSFLSEYDFLVLFLSMIIISLIVYQYPTKKQIDNHSKWTINRSTKIQSIIMIGIFGIYAFLSDIYFILPYDNIVSDVLGVVLTPLALLLTMTLIVYVLPLGLCGMLLFKGIKQAIDENNPRLILNPFIIAAVVSTFAGGKRLYDIALLSF